MLNWLAVNTAPCGSRISTSRVQSESEVLSTVPPRRSTDADGGVPVGHRERDVPVRFFAGQDGSHPADRVGETGRCADGGLAFVNIGVRRRGEVVAVPG